MAETKGHDIRNGHEHILPVGKGEEEEGGVGYGTSRDSFGAVALLLNKIVSWLLPKAEEK